ncbi:MAG TPA: S1 RNA-binding domain-containing protein, partial [Flavobacteriales bacterium]|nr:S1 RNA-binding domain-containing protein [Flavobacteriales bacterium]
MTTEKQEASEAIVDSETQAAEKQDKESTETADTTEKAENNVDETATDTGEQEASESSEAKDEVKEEEKETTEEAVEATTEDPAEAEATTEDPAEAEAATEEPAEVEATTEEPVEAEAATEEPVEAEAATEEPAEVEATTEEPVEASEEEKEDSDTPEEGVAEVVAEEEPKEEKPKPEAEKKSDGESDENQPKAEKPTAKAKARKLEDEPLKDFDWSQVDAELDEYSKEDREKFEKLYGDSLKSISEGEVVAGTIVSKNNREVIINIGFKSESIVSISEFRYNPDLKVGDEVDVFIEIQEDKNGQLILSHKQARALMAWDKVNAALNTDEVITGFVKCRTKGGLIVDVFGIEAFLPGSQIDVKPVRDYDMYVGKTMEFRVVKINKEFKNVVVSHKALIESELKEQRKGIIAKLEKGQVLEGMVKNITSYGVFMDLGGVDGLVHITDLSYGRISHPEEIVSLDEKLNVVILDFDENKTRIQLGLKQLSEHPWDS